MKDPTTASELSAYLLGVGFMGMTATGLDMAGQFQTGPAEFTVFALLTAAGIGFAYLDVKNDNE